MRSTFESRGYLLPNCGIANVWGKDVVRLSSISKGISQKGDFSQLQMTCLAEQAESALLDYYHEPLDPNFHPTIV